jgi:hypothetical protein
VWWFGQGARQAAVGCGSCRFSGSWCCWWKWLFKHVFSKTLSWAFEWILYLKNLVKKYEDIYNKYLCKNFFMLHSTDADNYIYIYMSTHHYEYTHILSIWAFLKDWVSLILRFIKLVKERLAVDDNVIYH